MDRSDASLHEMTPTRVRIGTGGPPGPSESLTSLLDKMTISVRGGMSRPGRYRCVRAGKMVSRWDQLIRESPNTILGVG